MHRVIAQRLVKKDKKGARRRRLAALQAQVLARRRTPRTTVADRVTTTPVLQDVVHEHHLADRMRTVRLHKQRSAAYRLAGLSLYPCPDQDLLALRLDIAVQGHYVACHHVFFDMVAMKEEKYLRVVQHTLPGMVPLTKILRRTLGGVAKADDEALHKLRDCANELYQACYCHAVRKEAYEWLKKQTEYETSELRLGEDILEFRLASSVSTIQVSMRYEDPMRSTPTKIIVRNSSQSIGQSQAAHISDDEDVDLQEKAAALLRQHPVEVAVPMIAKEMTEW